MVYQLKNIFEVIKLFRIFIVLLLSYFLIDVELKYFITHFMTVTLDYRLMKLIYDFKLNHFIVPQNLTIYSGIIFIVLFFNLFLRKKVLKYKKLIYLFFLFILIFFIDRAGFNLLQFLKEYFAITVLFLFCNLNFTEKEYTQKKYFHNIFYFEFFRSYFYIKTFSGINKYILSLYKIIIVVIPFSIFCHSLLSLFHVEKMHQLKSINGNKYLNDTYYSKKIGDDLYFTYNNFEMEDEGLYVYSFKSKEIQSIVNYYDPHRFELNYPYVYFYDRDKNEVVKYHINYMHEIWRAKVLSNASYLIFRDNNKILAVSEFGSFYFIDKESGKVFKDITIDERSDYIQYINDEAYFINDSLKINKLDKNNNFIRLAELPDFKYSKVLNFLPRAGSGRFMNWTYSIAKENKIFVSTLWGRIWVYDFKNNEWIDHYETQFGVRSFTIDRKHNYLITVGFLNGIVEIIDLKTKEVLKRFRGGSLSRYITLDIKKKIGLIHTRGRGIWRFDY